MRSNRKSIPDKLRLVSAFPMADTFRPYLKGSGLDKLSSVFLLLFSPSDRANYHTFSVRNLKPYIWRNTRKSTLSISPVLNRMMISETLCT